MSKKEEYVQKTEALLEPIILQNNFELVDVEYVREMGTWFLRIYIDKEGGITLNDCEMVNRTLGDLLDEKDFIEESYTLEVSSPGLGRQLKKDKDFRRSIGEEVEVKFYKSRKIPVGKKEASVKELEGILLAFDEETITLETEFSPEYIISREDISLIKLAVHF